jgi:hypothetical protein
MAILSSDLIRQGAAGASTGYTINNSIRFNDNDNAYLSRTISSTSETKTNTISMWVKRGNLGNSRSGSGSDAIGQTLFQSGRSALNFFEVNFGGTTAGAVGTPENALRISSTTSDSIAMKINTTAIFRDPSAWYHIVAVVDTTNSISNERLRLYVNGNRQTDLTSTLFPSKDTETELFRNTSNVLSVGAWVNPSESVRFLDGYLTEMHVVNGYAYGPEYFGEFNSNGIWIPKEYTGAYGTNGFYIKGEDSSDLGNDSSGNNNDFTSNNLASNDQVEDTPTNNQITFNPLNNQRSGGTLSNGNLDYTGPSTRTLISLTANIPKTGKWAVAFKATNNSNDEWNMGITKATNSNFGDAAGSNEAVGASDGIQFLPSSNDAQLYDYLASATIDPSLPITTSDEFWMAVDTATGKCFLGIYDASSTSMKFVAADSGLDGNPATGDNPTITISDMIGSGDYTFAVNSKNSNVWTLLRSTDVSGTTPTGYTYFENVKDLL